jgi:hypothetical protein
VVADRPVPFRVCREVQAIQRDHRDGPRGVGLVCDERRVAFTLDLVEPVAFLTFE